MTTPAAADDTNIPLTNTPMVYADTVVGLAVGPFVSKIILGVENPGQQSVPSLQISMPTNALHDLAKHIATILKNEDAQKNIAKGHGDFQSSLASTDD